MKDNTVYLRHIAECIRRIEENIESGREHFLATHTLQDAVLRNLQTMADATQRLSNNLKIERPEVEWRSIAAFRNVLVHDYLGVDIDRIWEITQRDIPVLRKAILSLFQENPEG